VQAGVSVCNLLEFPSVHYPLFRLSVYLSFSSSSLTSFEDSPLSGGLDQLRRDFGGFLGCKALCLGVVILFLFICPFLLFLGGQSRGQDVQKDVRFPPFLSFLKLRLVTPSPHPMMFTVRVEAPTVSLLGILRRIAQWLPILAFSPPSPDMYFHLLLPFRSQLISIPLLCASFFLLARVRLLLV